MVATEDRCHVTKISRPFRPWMGRHLEVAGRGVPVLYGARPAAGGVPSGRRLLRTSDVSHQRVGLDGLTTRIHLQPENEKCIVTVNVAWIATDAFKE